MKNVIFAICVLFACIVPANADTVTVATSGDWTAAWYSTAGYSNYDPANNANMVDHYITGGFDQYKVPGETRVYNGEVGDCWATDVDGAPWIGIWNGLSAEDPSYSDLANAWNEGGYYTFSTAIAWWGSALDNIELNIWHDNDLVGVILTDVAGNFIYKFDFNSVGQENFDTPTFVAGYDLNLDPGIYNLTVIVANGLSNYIPGSGQPGFWDLPYGPVGIRVEGTASGQGSTPEPATLAILGTGLLGTMLMRRRKLVG